MKKIFLTISTIFFGFLFTNPVLAVTKSVGNLEVTFDEPIFPSTVIWYPAFSLNKELIIKNKGDKTETTIIEARNVKDEGGLGQIFRLRIEEGDNVVYEKDFSDWWQEKEVRLSEVEKGQTKTYKLTVVMDKDAGNEYQKKTATFDLAVGFLGKEEIILGGGGNGTGGLGGCFDSKPGLPANLRAIVGPGINQVTLFWDPPSPPYTYFLVAYSDTDTPKWGNPNIGMATSYTVSGLGGGTYNFWVRAGNGCMPGGFVGPVSVALGGQVQGVAEGFTEGVLGVETQFPSEGGILGGGISTESGEAAGESGEVSGVETGLCPFWWIVLLGQTLVLGVYYYFQTRRRKLSRLIWIFTPLVMLVAWSLDRWAHSRYTPSPYCSYVPFLSIVGAFLELTVFIYFFLKNREKSAIL